MFVTFYSYKGGVGRSLALANVACLMAGDTEHPQRVLVWDFDLEAPGLHRLFPPKKPQSYGFVDLVYEYATTGNIPEVQDYIYESNIRGVYVLPAGKIGGEYCQKLQKIDWTRFFGSNIRDPSPFFSALLKGIKNMPNPFDYVLIDSRTGLNDQAGICTQILPEILIVLFRVTEQNIDGLEHLIPAIRSQLKARRKENSLILPVASQVRAINSQEQSEIMQKLKKIFEKELEYIRFDEDLVSKERLFCLPDEIENLWPCPPVVDDYKRICDRIREQNKEDTRTAAGELLLHMQEYDTTTSTMLLMQLLPRRPMLPLAWNAFSDVFEKRISKSRKQEFKKIVYNILREDPGNYFAHQGKAACDCDEAKSPHDTKLKKAENSLRKAIKYAPDPEKANVFRSIAAIESVQGNLENAIVDLKKSQELLPRNNQVNLDLAMLYLRMGAKYFVLSAEELNEIPPDIGEEKYCPLAYIWAFLGEPKKTEEAIKTHDKSERTLLEAHVLLIKGKRNEALRLADKKRSSPEDFLFLANLAEFYLCAEDFDKVDYIFKKYHKSLKRAESDIGRIKNLSDFLRKKNKVSSEEMTKIASDWEKPSWNFNELLMFRECCIRDKKGYGKALDVIEKMIQYEEFNEITSQVLGPLKRTS